MDSFHRDFHSQLQLLHVGGVLYKFVAGYRFLNPGQNPAFPVGGFLVWTGLHGAEDIGEAISASNADMAALYR